MVVVGGDGPMAGVTLAFGLCFFLSGTYRIL
jgi:hypothetical protein